MPARGWRRSGRGSSSSPAVTECSHLGIRVGVTRRCSTAWVWSTTSLISISISRPSSGWTMRCWSAPVLAAGLRPRSWCVRPRASPVWCWSTPLASKFSGRDERDIADMHALPHAEYIKLAWADPAKGEVEFTALPDSELAAIVRGREAFALYGWKPYMHNPRLKRWLHRIDRPTLLLWGAEDGIVTPAYADKWRRAIPNARLELIAGAGHFPHWEQPEAFVDKLTAFIEGNR